MSQFVCAYFGPPNQCQECGGLDETGTGFCDLECRESRALRDERRDAAEVARRAAEDAFAAEVARLRAEGRSYEECDRLLAHMPT